MSIANVTAPMTDAELDQKTFGASAPLKALQQKFGFEPEGVVTSAKVLLGRR